MKAHPKMLPVALAVAAVLTGGAAFAQAGKPNTGPHTTFGSSGNASGTASSGNVTINTQTGVITNADGTVTTLAPGQTVIVLPSAGNAVGAPDTITGVIVPANSASVRAILAAFAGSSANLAALEQGLINRTPITLTSASGSVTFNSPTLAMTQTDSTQALLLATSQLGSLGLSQPSPQQIQAALLGGTVSGSAGQSVALTGVLQLRRQGLNFVQIAQAMSAQAAFGFQGTTTATAPTSTGPREPARSAAGTGTARGDGGVSSSAGTTPAPGTSASTAPATGSASSAPPAGSASATRGNPSATGGSGLR